MNNGSGHTEKSTVIPATQQAIWNSRADLLIGCGLWTIPLLIGAAFLPSDGLFAGALIFQALCLVCNNPHYAATIFRAYASRETIQDHRLYTVYGTAALLAVGATAVAFPILIPVLFTVYLTWSPYHYTGQNYGIGAMFQGRHKVPMDPLERRLIRWGFTLTFAVWAVGAHTGISGSTSFVSLQIPPDSALPLRLVLFVGSVALLGTGLVGLLARVGVRPCIPLLAITLTQVLWFLAPAGVQIFGLNDTLTPAYFSSGALAFMHCAQYLWITSYAARRESTMEGTSQGKPNWKLGAYLGPLMILGIALFVPGPWLLSRVGGLDFVSGFLLVTSLVNIHHFMIDGVIWKLRDKKVSHVLVDPQDEIAQMAGNNPRAGTKWLTRFSPKWMVLGTVLILWAAVDLVYHAALQPGAPDGLRPAATVLNSRDSRPLIQAAKAAAAEGRTAEAIAYARQATSFSPYSDAQFLLGTLLVQSGQTSAALAHYERQVSLVRPELTTYMNYGVLKAQSGDTTGALTQLLKAASLAPDNPEALVNAGESLMAAGRAKEALNYFDRALNILVPIHDTEVKSDPQYMVRVALRSAAALEASGNTRGARERLSEARALAAKLGVEVP